MKRSEARRLGSALLQTADRSAVAPGQAPDGEEAGRSPAGELGCVGAYWKGSRIRARFRDREGTLHLRDVPAEHSFFLRAEDWDRQISGAQGTVGASLRASRVFLEARPEGEWIRVIVRDRDALNAICEPRRWADSCGVKTYEGDLHPVKRWFLDGAIKIGRPRRVYLDAEAYLPRGMGDFRSGLLLIWALVDDEDREVAVGILEANDWRAEATLLRQLVAALEPYDQVVAWNGDRFDFEFLKQRAEVLGVDIEFRRWLWLDHMVLAKRMNVSASKSGAEKQSFALAAWAKHFLGETKVVDLAEGQHVAWKKWLAGGEERALLARYCSDDAGKMARIEGKTGFVELHQTICETAGVLPDSRTLGPKQSVEMALMRLGRSRGMRFESFFGYEGGAEVDEDGKHFEGAFVLLPTKLGIVENVHVCDFSRLYPSIAQTFNLSPETLYKRREEILPGEERPEGICVAPGTEHWFRTEPRGLLPCLFDETLALRKIWDDKKAALPPGTEGWNEADKRSTAYKNMINAAFGVTGSVWSRFFVRECAESMTLGGAHLIKRVISEGERVGIETMSGDTDSAFCERVTRAEFEAFIARLNREVFPEIARERGARDCRIKLAYEKAFERVVYVAGKRYAGRYLHFKGAAPTEDSEPEVKGLEYKRGDTSVLARAMQAEVLDLLLGGGILPGSKRRPTCESNTGVFLQLVERWRQRVMNRELPLADIVVSKKLSREPEQYRRPMKKDGTHGAYPPQVRAALMARERGKDVGAGVRVEYVVANAKEKGLVLAEDYDGENVDRAHLWENGVYPATMRVLEACFPAIKWADWRRVKKFMGKPGQRVLFEF